MLNKYCLRNVSIDGKNGRHWNIDIRFVLDKEEEQIDLNELVLKIKSIEYHHRNSSDCIRSSLIECIESFSKYRSRSVDVLITPNDQDNSLKMISYSFPGCFQDQTIELITDITQFLPADSVLIFAFDNFVPDCRRLLLVNHHIRGWELPGGKLEFHESEIDAVIRETREESATELVLDSIKPLAQYYFVECDQRQIHRRTVFVGLIDSLSDTLLCSDTIGRKLIRPPKWTNEEIFNPNLNYSQYLKDNVYTICLQLAISKVGVH